MTFPQSPILLYERDLHFVTRMDTLDCVTPYAALKKEKDLKKLCNNLLIGLIRFLRYKGHRTGEDRDILCCEIITRNLTQAFSKFSALSHTWGNPTREILSTSPMSLTAVAKQSQSVSICMTLFNICWSTRPLPPDFSG